MPPSPALAEYDHSLPTLMGNLYVGTEYSGPLGSMRFNMVSSGSLSSLPTATYTRPSGWISTTRRDHASLLSSPGTFFTLCLNSHLSPTLRSGLSAVGWATASNATKPSANIATALSELNRYTWSSVL